MPHGVSLSAHAALVHGFAYGRPVSDRRHLAANTAAAEWVSMGGLPAQSRRVDARNGDRRRARLHVPRVRARSSDARELRHSPPARAAVAKPPPQDRADARAALLVAGHARAL